MPPKKINKPPRFEVDRITFSLHLLKALIPIKFKCRFFIQLKTFSLTSQSHIKLLGKSNDQYRAINSLVEFQPSEVFQFSSYLVYDNTIQRYLKTQLQLIVSLVSDNKGDEAKLVGRVRLDLAEFMIDNRGETVNTQRELQNCSVKKPQIAKIGYQLKLLKEEKINLDSAENRDLLYSQVDKAVFSDQLDYNEFLKQLYGEGYAAVLNQSKLNRSLVGEGKQQSKNKSMILQNPVERVSSIAYTKANNGQSMRSIEEQKREQGSKVLKPGIKKGSIVRHLEQDGSKAQSRAQQQVRQAPSHPLAPSYPLAPTTTQSPSKRKFKSPSSKTIPISPRAAQHNQQPQQQAPVQQQHQPQATALTTSMYQQQQSYIQQLQQQLTQAHQIIQQYKLQLDLYKQQTQQLQKEKHSHALQLQTSRSQQFDGRGITLQQYKKIITQKQQIIQSKTQIITQLQTTLQLFQKQSDQQLSQKQKTLNQLYQQINNKDQQLIKAYVDKEQVERKYEQCHQQLQSLLKNSNIQHLQKLLHQTNLRVKQLQAQLQQDQTNNAELQLKTVQLQNTILSNKQEVRFLQSQLNNLQQQSVQCRLQKQHAEKQASKVIEKFKTIQKEKYLLSQQIANMSLQQISLDKQVQQKTSTLSRQVNQLSLSLQEKENKISQLKFAIQSYQSTYEEETRKKNEEINQLKKKLQNFNKKEALLRQSLDLLENETVKIREFVQEKDERVRQLQEVIVSRDDEIQEKSNKINYFERKLRMNQNLIQEQQLQIKMLKAMGPSYNSNKATASQQQLQTRLFILSQSNMQLLKNQKLLNQDLNEKQILILELEKSLLTIDPLKNNIKALEDKLLGCDRKISQLKQQLKSQMHQSLLHRNKTQELNSELQHVYTECVKFQQQAKKQQQEKLMIYGQLQEELLKTQQLTEDNQILNQNVMTLQKHLDHSQKELFDLNSRLKHTEQQLYRKQSLLQKTNIQSAQVIKKPSELLLNSSRIKQQSPQQSSKTSQMKNPPSSIQINKPSSDPSRTPQQQQIYKLTQELQGYKQREEEYMVNVLDLQMQVDKLKEEKNKLVLQPSLASSHKSNPLQRSINKKPSTANPSALSTLSPSDKHSLHSACQQLQQLIEARLKSSQAQSLIQLMVSNSELMAQSSIKNSEEQGNLIMKQKNKLQEKSRILSRQVQKIKSLIVKKTQLNYKQKSQLVQLIKPCQNITNQLIKLVENFAIDNQDQNLN